MKIVQINTFSNGSTGNIMMQIHRALLENNHESYVVWGRGRKPNDEHEICISNKLSIYIHVLYSRLTGKTGFASKISTKKLLKKLDSIKPDIIHLHNIHGYYINIELLFDYLKKNSIEVIWTLHDCWAFTGQCPYFTRINCNKWKTHCLKCPMLNEYPKSFKDNSYKNFSIKKALFNNINMTLVVPSHWLASLVKESFLKHQNIIVINNGIDLNKFLYKKNNLKNIYHIENKKVILGVANVWDKRKGLDDFINLSKIIDKNFIIFLVGLTKKQISSLPKNIIGIERTKTLNELVEIYSMADVFFNASLEETFGLTTIEAMACGTPTIVYNSSALPEIVNGIGEIAIKNNIDDVYKKIKIILKSNINRKKIASNASKYCIENQLCNYINLYKNRSEINEEFKY